MHIVSARPSLHCVGPAIATLCRPGHRYTVSARPSLHCVGPAIATLCGPGHHYSVTSRPSLHCIGPAIATLCLLWLLSSHVNSAIMSVLMRLLCNLWIKLESLKSRVVIKPKALNRI
ncbi:hypothetical protein PoB_005476200 [Plakobranchus ocellatus]|uniref:Uncharacterized protein n=1 Tax=Plakobranchus ocellatus TaxID=259542 RepID=A0AAV4C9M3_9GAST|nr:hypothetical protein PoB_005476200 [Plakobranchus ocellatus]